jgi:hypothetical protein
MKSPLTNPVLIATLLCGILTSTAQTFDYGVTDRTYDGYNRFPYEDRYERHYSRDIFEEIQRAKEDRKTAELVKKYPPEDWLHARLSKRMNDINSTNFIANTNRTPIEIVPGLSSGD